MNVFSFLITQSSNDCNLEHYANINKRNVGSYISHSWVIRTRVIIYHHIPHYILRLTVICQWICSVWNELYFQLKRMVAICNCKSSERSEHWFCIKIASTHIPHPAENSIVCLTECRHALGLQHNDYYYTILYLERKFN